MRKKDIGLWIWVFIWPLIGLALYFYCVHLVTCENNKDQREKREAKERKADIADIVAAIRKKKPPTNRAQDAITGETSVYCTFPCDGVKKTIDDPVALFTCLLAYLVLLQLTWMVRQEEVLKESVGLANEANKLSQDNSVASRRAWISFEVSIEPPTKITETEGVFAIIVNVKNLGQTPAFNLWINAESWFMADREPFMDVEKRIKASLAVGQLTLFPGEPFIWRLKWSQKHDRPLIGKDPRMGVEILVGAGYKIMSDTEPHLTYRTYSILNLPFETNNERLLNPGLYQETI